jgi:hypothetical protein
MSNPMKTFVTDDGRKFLIPGSEQREPPLESPYDSEFFCCECHSKMGNDFYFLPINSCLRKDKRCNRAQ